MSQSDVRKSGRARQASAKQLAAQSQGHPSSDDDDSQQTLPPAHAAMPVAQPVQSAASQSLSTSNVESKRKWESDAEVPSRKRKTSRSGGGGDDRRGDGGDGDGAGGDGAGGDGADGDGAGDDGDDGCRISGPGDSVRGGRGRGRGRGRGGRGGLNGRDGLGARGGGGGHGNHDDDSGGAGRGGGRGASGGGGRGGATNLPGSGRAAKPGAAPPPPGSSGPSAPPPPGSSGQSGPSAPKYPKGSRPEPQQRPRADPDVDRWTLQVCLFFIICFLSVRKLVVLTTFFSTWQAAECQELHFNGIPRIVALARGLVDAAAAPAQQAAGLGQAIESLNVVVNQVCASVGAATEV